MALAFAIKFRDATGKSVRTVDVTLDNSYPSPGGWAVTPQNVGLGLNGRIDFVEVEGSKDGYILQWDEVNNKLKVFQGDNTNAAAAPAIELPNTSAVMNAKVVRLKVWGIGTG